MSQPDTYVREMYDSTHPTREWISRDTDEVLHTEPLLQQYGPESNLLERKRHCVGEILGGSNRDVCRAMVYGEDEWRDAVREAGKDPSPFGVFRKDSL